MNEKRFTDSITISTESQHRLIGLEYFKWVMSIETNTLKIYYKTKLLESYSGKKAIELYQQFNEGFHRINHLNESEIKRISENVCRVNDSKIKYRGMYEVFSRWLFYHYFNYFTDNSLQSIGNYYNQDHSTVIHGIRNVRHSHLNGWRLTMKIKFENEINSIHEKVGIKRIFR